MKLSKARKGSSRSSKSPKASRWRRFKIGISRTYGKPRRKKSVTAQAEEIQRSDDTPSSVVAVAAAEHSTVEGLDVITSMTEPAATPASAPATSAPATSVTMPRPAAHSNVPSSYPEHSVADTNVLKCEQSVASTSNNTKVDIKETGKVSLWDKACANLKERDENSKYVSKLTKFGSFNGICKLYCLLIGLKSGLTNSQLRLLEQNLNELNDRDNIAKDIEQIVNTKQDRLHDRDGLTQSTGRKFESRSVRFVTSTRDLAMGLARLDSHGIAPIVLGGVYSIVRILQNDTEESRAAMTAALELARIVEPWTGIEKIQISKNSRLRMKEQYQELSELIVRLYEGIIVLLGTMIAYFDKNRVRKWFKMLGWDHC